MKTKEKKQTGCCSCQADFQAEVNELVDNVEHLTKEEREAKAKEVEAAFEKEEK